MGRKRYRIEQIEGQNSSVNKKSAQELDPKLTKKLVNEKMYLYIDINAESGFKTMYECDSSDEDDQIENIGKKYKVNLNDLQCPNSKAINFLHKMKEGSRKKKRALSMIKDQLKKSTQKFQKLQPKQNLFALTKYRFSRNLSQEVPSDNSQKKPKYKSKQNKMLTMLNSSILNEISDKKANYYTLQSYTSRRLKPTAEERAERYMHRIKVLLPSIKTGRHSVAF